MLVTRLFLEVNYFHKKSMYKDIKEMMKICISKKDRQYNDQVKEDKRQTMVAKTINIQLKKWETRNPLNIQA